MKCGYCGEEVNGDFYWKAKWHDGVICDTCLTFLWKCGILIKEISVVLESMKKKE